MHRATVAGIAVKMRCWLLLLSPRDFPNIRPLMRGWIRPGGRRQVRSFDSSSLMLLDFEVQRCTRRCAATDRALEPGDVCYSVLEMNGADVVRKDFCAEAWNGPPEAAFGWWRSRMPEPTAKKIKLAPNDVLLELFDQLADRPDQQDLRYVLTLLLVRRRVLRLMWRMEHCRSRSDANVSGNRHPKR